MASMTDAEFDAAEVRGRTLLDTEPRAVSARFDRENGRIVVELANQCAYAFPAELVEDLQGAAPGDLADVRVDGAGLNLHFPALDVDLFVPALVAGIFGTKDWSVRALARHAGQAKTPAKAEAARTNGAKGGRPRKTG